MAPKRLIPCTPDFISRRSKIDPNSSQETCGVVLPNQEETLDERFETNPARNRVLATADKIRRMLKIFQDGDGHVDVGDTEQAHVCVNNDIEVLRRQIRKVRRWQHNAQPFSEEDVDDLQLIISAIERHLR